MKDNPNSTKPGNNKKYTKPSLKIYGSISNLTAGRLRGKAGKNDDDSYEEISLINSNIVFSTLFINTNFLSVNP